MQADTKQYPRFSVVKQDKCSGWDTENPGFIYWDICIKILVVVGARTGGKHAAETETCQNYFYE